MEIDEGSFAESVPGGHCAEIMSLTISLNCLQAPPLPMKRRSFFSILVSIVAVLLLISAGGLYWLLAQSPLKLLQGSPIANPSATIFVPRQAPIVASLLVNPDDIGAFRQAIAAPASRRQARAELEQWQRGLLANTGLDYGRDIQPWLGDELMVAITGQDFDRDSSNGQQPGYLLILTSRDGQKSREFLQLFWQKRAIGGTDLVFEQYKGTKLIYGVVNNPFAPAPEPAKSKPKSPQPNPQNSVTLASAVVGDRFVLFANSPKVLRDAINNVQAEELGLGSSSSYQKALDSLEQSRVGLVYLNLPQLTQLVGKSSDALASSGNPVYDSLAVALGFNRQGLLAETALISTSGQPTANMSPSLSDPVDALQYIPAGTPLTASGSDLGQFWQQLTDVLASYPTLAQLVNQPLNDLQRRWNLNLTEEVFQWVKGEYALALIPRSDGSDWVFVAEKADADAREGVAHLDELARQQGLTVGPLQLGNSTVSAWTRLATAPKPATGGDRRTITLTAQVEGLHTPAKNYEIFATSAEAMNQALQAGGGALASQKAFGQAIDPLEKPNSGYFYIDWPSTQEVLERRIPLLRVIGLTQNPFFSHLQSITVSGYGRRDGIQRGGVFLRLG